MKYGIKRNVCGVYLIENKINGKKYVGASNDVSSRISQHMSGRIAKKYNHLDFYKDVLKLGYEGFEYTLLEECTEDEKLEREQFWYDKINPEYNLVRPTDNMFKNDLVRQRSIAASQTKEHIEQRKKLYNTPKYKKFFRTNRTDVMRPVIMIDKNGNEKTFISIRGAARWLDDNTNYTSKNKASKVKAVCDGERKSAYGYKFKYSIESVETILKRSRESIDTISEAVN